MLLLLPACRVRRISFNGSDPDPHSISHLYSVPCSEIFSTKITNLLVHILYYCDWRGLLGAELCVLNLIGLSCHYMILLQNGPVLYLSEGQTLPYNLILIFSHLRNLS
jgi:hypothetical protein